MSDTLFGGDHQLPQLPVCAVCGQPGALVGNHCDACRARGDQALTLPLSGPSEADIAEAVEMLRVELTRNAPAIAKILAEDADPLPLDASGLTSEQRLADIEPLRASCCVCGDSILSGTLVVNDGFYFHDWCWGS